jgi:hypothetical protein
MHTHNINSKQCTEVHGKDSFVLTSRYSNMFQEFYGRLLAYLNTITFVSWEVEDLFHYKLV